MTTRPVHYSDLQLLHNFFCSKQEDLSIYDPEQRLFYENVKPVFNDSCCVNLSMNGKGKSELMKFYFGNNQWKEGQRFIYVNNPDGTMRWLMPSGTRSASHLALYNSASWKARLYKLFTSFLFSIGKGQLLASGSFFIEQKAVEAVKEKYGIAENENYTLFTGTRGDTRKVVLAVSSENKVTHFIKIPVSIKSKELVQNEINMLKELTKYDFTTLSLPRVTDPRINAYARLTNIKPAVTIPAQRISDLHVKALTELYNTNNENRRITASAAWPAITNNLEWMQREHELNNGLDEFKTRRIIHLLRKLYNSLPQDISIPVSVSHGDFTPWNMYSDSHRLYVYDWELSSNGIPMLFDLYHFIYQSQVLIHHESYSTISKTIDEFIAGDNVQRIIKKYSINTDLHYKMYLLFTISYYLRLYITEKELLMQAHWMIDVWADALESVNTGG